MKKTKHIKSKLKYNYYRHNLFVLGIALIIVMGLSIAYSILNANVGVIGEVAIRADKDIRITAIKNIGTDCGYDIYNPRYSSNTITIYGNILSLGCSLKYSVTITNKNNSYMELVKIDDDIYNNKKILYKLDGIELGSVFPPEAEVTFTITFYYDASLNTLPQDNSIGAVFEFFWQVGNDEKAPVIVEKTLLPKVFYITQADDIDLREYAVALDNADGDITDKMVITSFPKFDKYSPGIYDIFYDIQDKAGNSAETLKVSITIWNFLKIESGNIHTLALTTHGRLYAWGNNSSGALGSGNNTTPRTPIQITTIKNVVDIAATNYSSFAVTKDGKIYSWGEAVNGQLGDGTTANRNFPDLVTTPDGIKFIKIDAQTNSIGALTDDGDVYTWGDNKVGQLGDGTDITQSVPKKINISDIVDISQGGDAGAAINKSGLLFTWGNDSQHTLGDKNNSGAKNLPYNYSGLSDMKFVKVCRFHVIAISSSGQVYTWGAGRNGQLGNGTTEYSSTPYKTSITNGEEAGGYWNYSLIKTKDKKLYVFGDNTLGKFGLGNSDNLLFPTHNDNPVFTSHEVGNIKSITALMYAVIVLTEDNQNKVNTTYGMGENTGYLFGNGTNINSTLPVAWKFTPPKPE